jgi:hypothetical protein
MRMPPEGNFPRSGTLLEADMEPRDVWNSSPLSTHFPIGEL